MSTEGCEAAWLPGANADQKDPVSAAILIVFPLHSYLVVPFQKDWRESGDLPSMLGNGGTAGPPLVGCAQKAVEQPGSLVQMVTRRLRKANLTKIESAQGFPRQDYLD